MRTLASFEGAHHNDKVVVCGCGNSLNEFTDPGRFTTIGVNDVGRLFQPTYLVVANWKHQFRGDRFHYVETSQAQYLFTHLSQEFPHPAVVRFRHGTCAGVEFSNPNVLHYSDTSTYMALCLAIHMGARLIGVIGIDYTENHFFGKTGVHPHVAYSKLSTIDEQFRNLRAAINQRGVKVFNLSQTSRLTAFPKISLEEFAALPPPQTASGAGDAPLRIVSYGTTPVAGVPAILARCINAATPHSCRCVWATNDYRTGAVFRGDVQWDESPAAAEAELTNADLVIVHNGKVDKRHRELLSDKAVAVMAHNYLWNVDQTFLHRGFPGMVVGQYQATLPEFKGWSVVPNPIPLWETGFQPAEKHDTVTICYTPYGKHESYPETHHLYWHAKGYRTTMSILDRLAARFPVRLEVIRNRPISHAQALEMKRGAHIVIDECVTGSYHRNSLEGLAAGCVVVNGVGLLPGLPDVIRYCAGGTRRNPFTFASLETLENVLTSLVANGTSALAAEGTENRRWMERHWNFSQQWEQFWRPVVTAALQHRPHQGLPTPRQSPAPS